MLRLSQRTLHTPMIRFTYAIAKNGGQPHVAAGAAAGAGAAGAGAAAPAAASTSGDATANVFDFYDQLPKHLRPHVFEEAEMETIQMGGAPPYVPKHLQKKKK